ncbi:UNVERIFIED_CONTAM: hypothetical protein FKN15_039295 [Acipenser sinensis]
MRKRKRNDKPKAVLTLESPGGEIFTGDIVTLSCGVEGDPAGWKYLWFKDRQGTALPQTDSSSVEGSSYTISSAALSHSGEYWCIAQRRNGLFYSEYSDSVRFNVSAVPMAVLTLETGESEMFATESVTLRCEVQGSSAEWNYTWYRDGNERPVHKTYSSTRHGDRYTINSADESHSGEYTCKGEKSNEFYSNSSNPRILKVSAQPKAVLTVEMGWIEIFISESMTLRCEVQGSVNEWNYTWYRDGIHCNNTGYRERYTVYSKNESYSRQYTCKGERTPKSLSSITSDPLVPKDFVLKWQLIVGAPGVTALLVLLVGLVLLCRRICRKPGEMNSRFTFHGLILSIINMSVFSWSGMGL